MPQPTPHRGYTILRRGRQRRWQSRSLQAPHVFIHKYTRKSYETQAIPRFGTMIVREDSTEGRLTRQDRSDIIHRRRRMGSLPRHRPRLQQRQVRSYGPRDPRTARRDPLPVCELEGLRHEHRRGYEYPQLRRRVHVGRLGGSRSPVGLRRGCARGCPRRHAPPGGRRDQRRDRPRDPHLLRNGCEISKSE